jgi:hypothetical protein
MAVISAYGAFRLLMVLLALWTFFAGFSLLTQGVGALSFGGGAAPERVAGAYMLVIAPIYVLLAWRREQYRTLLWVPYAAQLAIVIPTFYDLGVSHDGHFQDSSLIFIVSLIFLALLVYLWWSSHPLEHFMGGGEDDDDWDDDEDDVEDADEDDAGALEDEDGDDEPSGDEHRRIIRPHA